MTRFHGFFQFCSRTAGVFLLAAGLAHASVVQYDNLPDFTAAMDPNSAVESFDGLAADAFATSPLTFNPGVFSFSASSAEFYNSEVAPGDVVLSTTNPGDTIVFNILNLFTYAIGGYFWNTDIDFNPVPGTIALGLNDGTTVSLASGGASTFYGFVSDTPILSLSVTPAAGGYATVNNVYVAGSPAGVPEPGTAFAMISGLAALAFAGRRRLARR